MAQGPIVDRDQEKLGESDKGVILFRELLQRQLRIVEDGGEPMNVFRDPLQNQRVDVAPRDGSALEWPGADAGFMRRVNAAWVHSPVVNELVEKYRGKEALARPVT
jgi:5,5'-dehydrodivanillate O-demethylase